MRCTTAASAVAVAVVLGAVVAASPARDTNALPTPSASLSVFREANAPAAADVESLASAVERARTAVTTTRDIGRPVTGEARKPIVAAGRNHDDVALFPTERGSICVSMREAGGCNDLTGPGHVAWWVFGDSGGFRMFGAAADDVASVRIETGVGSVAVDLAGNALFADLPTAVRPAEIENAIIHVTFADGSKIDVPANAAR